MTDSACQYSTLYRLATSMSNSLHESTLTYTALGIGSGWKTMLLVSMNWMADTPYRCGMSLWSAERSDPCPTHGIIVNQAQQPGPRQ